MLTPSRGSVAALAYCAVHSLICVTLATSSGQCHLDGRPGGVRCKPDSTGTSGHVLLSTHVTRSTAGIGSMASAEPSVTSSRGRHNAWLLQGNSSKAKQIPDCGVRSKDDCAPGGRDCYWSRIHNTCKLQEERVSCGIYGTHKYNYWGPGCAACPEYGPYRDGGSKNCNGDCFWSQGACIKKEKKQFPTCVKKVEHLGPEPTPACGERSRESCAPSGRDCYWSRREGKCKLQGKWISCGVYGTHKYRYSGPGCGSCPDYGPWSFPWKAWRNCNGDCEWCEGTCQKK